MEIYYNHHMMSIMTEGQKKTLFRRQKLLLALLQAFGGRLPNIDLQKYLFLFTQTCQQDKSYEFVPYKFGCFSFQSHADRRRLIEVGAIVDTDNWWKLAGDEDYIAQINPVEQEKILLFADSLRDIKEDDLSRYVYKKYPYYAINSESAQNIMNAEELTEIKRAKPNDTGYKFFTIGYEGQSFEHYLNRLINNSVRMLCDVRGNPLSRKYGFSKSTLSKALDTLGIEYMHIPELGIVSEKRQDLKTQEDYDRLFDDYENTTLKTNHNSIGNLHKVFLEKRRIAITCFEAEPCMCHRSRVAKALSELADWQHHEIEHI